MPNVWFTSDPHYGHKNIVKKLSDWTNTDGCRDFNSVEEMNDAIVEGINSVVAADDTLYCLGDFNFGGIKNQKAFRSRLVCDNIHLILGNHDFNHGSIPVDSVSHGFTSVRPYAEITIGGKEIILFHYAQRVWNRQGKGSWHLYGHSHGMLPKLKNFSMDVGMDRDIKTGPVKFNPVPINFYDLFTLFEDHKIHCEDGHERDEHSRPLR
jgi:calcineurin-like phosphoesterase family protein